MISVFNKEEILELARFLAKREVEIISTGGSAAYLKEQGIPVTDVSSVTGFPEILDGRVKTLHPAIHGGILAVRSSPEHLSAIREKGIEPIDLVAVNLYPFVEKAQEDLPFDETLEFIDIGGPAMIRAAAKNFKDVVVLSDQADYAEIMDQLEHEGDVSPKTRRKLAGKIFNLMSAYDAAVSSFLLEEEYPEYLSLSYRKSMELRYGENAHQSAACYLSCDGRGVLNHLEILNGKQLSFNNIKDMDSAWKAVWEFEKPACCGLKHNTPCGVALGSDVSDAYRKAHDCDPVSLFGGIVAFNRTVDKETAEQAAETFLELLIAPDYEAQALEVLRAKKNLRVIRCTVPPRDQYGLTKVDGAVLMQQEDRFLAEKLEYVTKRKATPAELEDLLFAMKVCKHVASNAIVVAKDGVASGIGGGQVSRIRAAEQALERGKGATVLASDAFFPFADVVDLAAAHGIQAIIQPGGSIRDEESIRACNDHGIAMVFTGTRHFKH